MSEVALVSLQVANLGKLPMLCGHSHTYRRGYDSKMAWMQARLGEGMRYTLLQVGGRNAGMIEYLPVRYAGLFLQRSAAHPPPRRVEKADRNADPDTGQPRR